MSQGLAPAVKSLTFDLSSCQAVAVVDPGPSGRTESVDLYQIVEGEDQLLGTMVHDHTEPSGDEIWIYQFLQEIPGGEYKAVARIWTLQTASATENTAGGPCGDASGNG